MLKQKWARLVRASSSSRQLKPQILVSGGLLSLFNFGHLIGHLCLSDGSTHTAPR